ncbi:MAG: hypothetical protein J4F43_07505 [Dehalococcoidia bacterium]|nr:hypothetical protein [Dehalococcoidia bacterium]
MENDPYIFFTKCHRLYIQGVRRAVRERLQSVFCTEWWEKGVRHALPESSLSNLDAQIEKFPDRARDQFLDASHFGWIITKHHNEIFLDPFPDSMRAFADFGRLIRLRNEWAHIQDIAPARAMQAARLMQHILASLRCEEALEVERMSQEIVLEPDGGSAEHLPGALDSQDHTADGESTQDSTFGLWDLWRQLNSYLVLETSVEPTDEPRNDSSRVTVTVHNTAPDSKNWPIVHFRSVAIQASTHGTSKMGPMAPGETRQKEFSFPANKLIDVEFEVYGEIDPEQLFRFRRTICPPGQFVAPLRQEFLAKLESIGINVFLNRVLDTIDTPDPQMTLADIARVRDSVRQQSEEIDDKRSALGQLFEEFRLDRDSTLGARMRNLILALVESKKKLDALDDAIGRTDLELMNGAVSDLKQVQLAALRVENTIRTMTSSA